MRYSIIILLFISATQNSLCQNAYETRSGMPDWMLLINDPNASYHDVVRAFEEQTQGIPESEIPALSKFRMFQMMRADLVDEDGYYNWKDQYQKIKQFQNQQPREKRINTSWEYAGIDSKLKFMETGNQTGRIDRIAFHPTDPDQVWAGAPSGGLWRSYDLGESWEIVSDEWMNLGVGDIVIDQADPNRMWVATGDADGYYSLSYGVQRSIDGGQTWELLDNGLSTVDKIYRLVQSPDNSDRLYCGTEDGLFVSSDAGNTWSRSNLVDENVTDIELNPSNPQIVYVITSTLRSNNIITKFYRSANGGSTFTRINLGFENTQVSEDDIVFGRIAVSPENSDVVYVAGYTEKWGGSSHIYKSTDRGESFSIVSSTDNVGFIGRQFSPQLHVNPSNHKEIIIASVWARRSLDGGVTWGDYPILHADQHDFEWHPLTNDLWIGNDGGIEQHTDNGIVDIIGIENAQYWRIASYQGGNNIVAGGVQDNGSHIRINDEWLWLGYGDGMQCWIDPVDSSLIYISVQFGQDFATRSYQGDTKWTAKTVVGGTEIGDQRGSFEFRFAMHPYDNRILYALFEDIWVTYNAGSNWTQLTNGDFGWFHSQCDIAISPSNPDIIYISGQDGQLIKTEDGGNSWIELDSNLGRIYSVEVHPTNPNLLWLSGPGIWESKDGGQTWENISGSLPNVFFRDVVYQPGSKNGLYCVNDDIISVYYKDDDLDDWIDYSEGLPNTSNPSCNLDINMADQKIRLGTWGRGLWEADLYDVNPAYAKAPPKPPILTRHEDQNGTILISDPFMDVDTFLWYKNGDLFRMTLEGSVQIYTPGEYQARIVKGPLKSYLSRPLNLFQVFNPTECDGDIDAAGVCNGTCTADLDNDSICDDVDPCVGGLDALGICNGTCEADEDQDGICDDEDDFVGVVDTISVTVYDTTFVTIYDTTRVTVFDTSFITVYDTTHIAVTDTLYIDVIYTDVSDVVRTKTIKVFPNPNNDIVVVEIENYSTTKDYSLRIINVEGKEAFSSKLMSDRIEIPVSSVGPPGTYFIQLFDADSALLVTRALVLF